MKLGADIMKKVLCVTMILLAVMVSVYTAVYVSGSGSEVAARSESVNAAQLSEKAPQYVLYDYNGTVAVFTYADQSKPLIITDIDVRSLRKTDQQLLKRGVELETYEDVVMLLEDLDS